MAETLQFIADNWLPTCGVVVDIIALIIWYQSGLSPVAVLRLVFGVLVRIYRALFKCARK